MSRSLPKLRRHKHSQRGVVTLSGKDVYLGHWPPGKKTPPEEVWANYQRELAEWLAGGKIRSEPVRSVSPQIITVSMLMARFWKHAEIHYRQTSGQPGNELHCFRSALRPVRELYASLPVAEFSPLKLKAVRVELVRRDLSRENINNLIRRVRHVFKWGVENELVPPSVLHGLQAVAALKRGRTEAKEGRVVRPVRPELVEKTLPTLPPAVADIVRLLTLTGARCGEICQLRPCDLDRSGPVWLFTPETHKNAHKGKSRVIAIGPKAQAVLLPLLADLQPDEYVFNPSRGMRKKKAKPVRAKGVRYTTHAVGRCVTRACEMAFPMPETAGPEWRRENWWTLHQLRHSAATEIRKVFGLDHAQSVLGHAGADMTQRYAELGVEKAVEVALKIG
ncbi:tyrosine-type recombinase/integrase [Zavarzinella formosa]|uniref:tyrosine-type recombinase/integrase n=1 Tax=Zavarzinella formosa TaxID=360055 RepID=UPI0002EE2786|nr:site-specific integrase [Zavarzinella formosa]